MEKSFNFYLFFFILFANFCNLNSSLVYAIDHSKYAVRKSPFISFSNKQAVAI